MSSSIISSCEATKTRSAAAAKIESAFKLSRLSSTSYLLPSDDQAVWNPVFSSHRNCYIESRPSYDTASTTSRIVLKTPSSLIHQKSPGWFCHVTLWTTTCDFRWYGSKYITHSIHGLRPSESICKEGIKKYISGELEQLGFPPPDCGWNSITDSSLTSIRITPHDATFDPYNEAWVDPSFPAKTCFQEPCQTAMNNTVWMSQFPISEECSLTDLDVPFVESLVSNDVHDPSKTGIIINNYGFISFQDSCIMNYCQLEGLRLRNGIWVAFPKGMVNLSPPPPFCPVHTEIKPLPETNQLKGVEDVESLLKYLLCQETWNKIENNNSLTPTDMAALSPTSEGIHPTYLLLEGKLIYKNLPYKAILLTGYPKGDHFEINLQRNPAFKWKKWQKIGNSSLLAGPNGLLKQENIIKIPNLIIRIGELDADLKIDLLSRGIPHPNIAFGSVWSVDQESIFFDDSGTSTNPLSSNNPILSGLKDIALAFVMTLFSFILIWLTLKGLHLYLTKRSQSKIPKTVDSEANQEILELTAKQ